MKWTLGLSALLFLAANAPAQIQVELRFPRLQYIAHEPILATVKIANFSGRDIDLRDDDGHHWFGFEINSGEGRLLAPLSQSAPEPGKPDRSSGPLRAKVWVLNSSLSRGPLNFQPLSVG